MAKALASDSAGAVYAAATQINTSTAANSKNNETSQRVCELLDEITRKDNALEQFRLLFETMSKDYEVAQRQAERAQSELGTLATKCEVQKQEILALRAKSALQESTIKREDDEWERRTRQLRQDFEAVVEERDAIAKERETQWQHIRDLRLQMEEQRRKHSEAESAWACRVEETRRTMEEKARADLCGQEDLLQAREAEFQNNLAQLESRLADALAETRSLQLGNEGLVARVEELQRSLRRQGEMTQQLQDAHRVIQMEKAQLGECMNLERQAYRQRQEYTQNSFKAQVQELQRLCEQLEHERDRLESSAARVEREMQQNLQRAREVWLQQQHQLESTIELLRGDLTRERMRFDKAEESRQRAEALLARARCELEASQQREASLQDAMATLQKADAKRVAARERLEGEVSRLLATVSEREREIEWWRSKVDRMEWRTRLEGARYEEQISNGISSASFQPPPPPLPLPPSNKTRKLSFTTPHRQVQHTESIDYTPLVGSPFPTNTNQTLSATEENDVELLRSIVQEVLQECVTQMEPSFSFTKASTPVAGTATAAAASSTDKRVPTSGRCATPSCLRRENVFENSRFDNRSQQNRVALPISTAKDVPLCAASSSTPPEAAPLPSTATSSDSSILRTRAPLFTSAANDSSFGSSSMVLQPQRFVATLQGQNEVHSLPKTESTFFASLSAEGETGINAAAAVVQKYDWQREEARRQMRQTLLELKKRQQNILSSIECGVIHVGGCDEFYGESKFRDTADETRDTSGVFSAATTASTSATSHISLPPSSSSARASTAAPAAPPLRLLALQERFATMPVA